MLPTWFHAGAFLLGIALVIAPQAFLKKGLSQEDKEKQSMLVRAAGAIAIVAEGIFLVSKL